MNISLKILTIILLTVLQAFAQVPIPKGGNIVNETWTTGNTYWIVTDVNVQSLTIQPGVIIEFIDQYSFNIDGEITAIASINDSIIFKSADANVNGWNGIIINSTATKAHFSFCAIEGAVNQSIYVSKSNVFQFNNSVINNTDGNGITILSLGNAIKASIKNSIIKNNSQSGIYLVKGDINVYNSIITENGQAGVFTTQNQDKLYLYNCVIADNDGAGITCTSTNGLINIVNSIIYDNSSSLDISTANINITYSDIDGASVYDGEGNVLFDPSFSDTISYQLNPSSFCINMGDPAPEYNDVYFPPSMGTERNDIGAYGGPFAGNWIESLTLESTLIDFGSVSISRDSTQKVKFYNYTDALINVTDISLSGADAEFFSITDTNFAVAAFDSNYTEITFSPNLNRVYNAVATVESDRGNIRINLTGQGLTPTIELSSTLLNFDSVLVEQDSLIYLTVYNTGQSELIIYNDSLKIIGTDSTDYSFGVITGNTNVAVSDFAQIAVTFMPSGIGFREAALHIYSNDPVNPIEAVILNGTGIKPVIAASDSAIDFGTIKAFDDSSSEITIYNEGSADLRIYKDNLQISGIDAADFTFENILTDLVITADDSAQITVTFTPADSGFKHAQLDIYSNDFENSPLSIDLSGTGFKESEIYVKETEINFGETALEENSQKQLKIYNLGNADLIIYKDSLNVSGESASHFVLETWTSDLVIPIGDSATSVITFSPSDSGYKEATLSIISNDPDNHEIQITLKGHGFAKPLPVIHFTPKLLDFSQVDVNRDSLLELVVSNIGQADLNVFSNNLKITGNDSSHFFYQEISGTQQIPFGDSIKIYIGFKPLSEGLKTAYLNISSNDPVHPDTTIMLTGTASINEEFLAKIKVLPEQINFNGNVYVNLHYTKELTIQNVGNFDLTISSEQLQIDGNNSSSFSFDEISSDIILHNGDSTKIRIHFTPTDTYEKTATLYIYSNDMNSPENVPLSGKASEIPQAKISKNGPNTSPAFTLGKNATIAYNISAVTTIDSVILNYKQGGESNLKSTSFLNTQDSLWKAELQGNLITERGLEYFIDVYYGGHLTETEKQYTSVNIPLIDFPDQTRKNKYQLVSVPLEMGQQTLADLFLDDLGTYNDKKYRVFDYNQQTEEFIELVDLDQKITSGKSVFLITKSPQIIDIENGLSLSFAADFRIDLKAGWNLIANPFAFPVAWSDVDSIHHIRYYDETSDWSFPLIMQPYEGYIVKVTNDTTIYIPPKETLAFPKESTGILAGAEWYFRIMGEGKDVYDRYNYIGVKANALNSIDRNDQPEPPPIGEYLSVSLIDHTSGKKFSTDFRAPDQDGYNFDIKIESNVKSTKTIQFQPENLPDNYDWMVVAPESKMILDKNNIAIKNNQTLSLLVGTSDYLEGSTKDFNNIPTKISLKQNYPNPFNPQTSIAFELPHNVYVKANVYNILGKKVKTLIDNQLLDAGYHTITWDGRNNQDTRVSSGVYFLHFKAGGYTKTIKMIMNN